MDLRNIKYFLAVAEAGSITTAAQTLHISQPPLSMAMAKLEAELGVTLFDRMPRGVALTPPGRYLQTAGRRLLAEERRISSTLEAMGKGLEGELRIGAEPMGLLQVVSSRIASFLAVHPRISFELMDAHPSEVLENLANGHLDLAVIPYLPEEPLPLINDVALSVDIVTTLPLTLIVPSAWNLDEHEPIDLATMRDKTWILPRRLSGARSLSRILDDRFTATGGSPKTVMPVPTVQSAAALVAAGVGISVTSSEMVAQQPGVSSIPVIGGWPDLPLGLIRRRDGIVTPMAERFAALCLPEKPERNGSLTMA